MAQLDVSDLLTDPDYIDALVCERHGARIGPNGVNSPTTREIGFWGVVTAEEGKELDRGADAETIHGSISIVSKFELLDGDRTDTADTVRWQSRRYTVKRAFPYTNFGSGFTQAECELVDFSG